MTKLKIVIAGDTCVRSYRFLRLSLQKKKVGGDSIKITLYSLNDV